MSTPIPTSSSIPTLGIYYDPTTSVKSSRPATAKVEDALAFLQVSVASTVTEKYGLVPPLNPMDLQGSYYPSGKLFISTHVQTVY